MLFKLKKEIEETKEIEVPCYVDYAGWPVKIVSANECIKISIDGIGEGIMKYKKSDELVSLYLFNGTPIEKSVFDNAMQDALSKFYRDSFESATDPSTDEEIREKIEGEFTHEKIYEDVTD